MKILNFFVLTGFFRNLSALTLASSLLPWPGKFLPRQGAVISVDTI